MPALPPAANPPPQPPSHGAQSCRDQAKDVLPPRRARPLQNAPTSAARPPPLQTIDHLIRKAGYNGAAVLVRCGLKVTRYQSTTCSLWYEDYSKLCCENGSEAPRRLRGGKQSPLVTVSASQ